MTTNKDLGARTLGGLLIKVGDENAGTRVAPGFTIQVNNFSAGNIIANLAVTPRGAHFGVIAGVLEERAQDVATRGVVAA